MDNAWLNHDGGWSNNRSIDSCGRCKEGTGAFGSSDRDPQQATTEPTLDSNTEGQHYVATALSALSLHDRDALYGEIHGIAHCVDETPAFLDKSCLELKREIHRLIQESNDTSAKGGMSSLPSIPMTDLGCRLDCSAFQAAEAMNSNYVHSRFHYLIFLRCERFDIPKAATRMLYFFQLKRELWGEHSLCVDIHQGLLSRSELGHLKTGF